ncbi:hypothetical protein [Blastomonas sp.]|uniref:hypothetical protein n=1 Tax=Blastomonas sp. TaxID=1909299 RepID=UPI0035945780
MKPAFASLFALTLLIGACADPEPTQERAPGGERAGERLGPSNTSPSARAVTIGEGGSRFAACAGRGRVGSLRGGELPVRDAPFDAAKQVGALQEGAQVYICTRSLDQQWLGVVIPPAAASPPDAASDAEAAAPSVDCGVSAPARAKRAYDGPCDSGWVENTFVAAVAS